MLTKELTSETISREIETAPNVEVVYLPLSRISPSPLNPRKHFDEAALQELADSIQRYGVQQPIIVRFDPGEYVQGIGHRGQPMLHYKFLHPVNGETTSYLKSCETAEEAQRLAAERNAERGYFIVMGERRFRASALAGQTSIPAIIREMDDQRHAEEALEENLRRKDLTPMETARGFKQCMDLGTRQADIGEKAGLTQGRVASLIGLLALPQDVQAMIDAGVLSAGHGIQLGRYKDFPALCSFLAKMAVDAQWPVRLLEAGLTRQVSQRPIQEGLLQPLPSYNTAFDWKATCVKDCPFSAFKGASDSQKGGYCLNPAHYKQLQAEALAAKETKAQEEAAHLREKAQEAAAAARSVARDAPTAALRNAAEKTAVASEATAKALEAGLPDLTKMSSDEYVDIDLTKTPPGCSESCTCRGRGKTWNGRIADCCLDPKRYQALKAAAKKEVTQSAKEALEARMQIAARRDLSFSSGVSMAVLLAGVLLSGTLQTRKRLGDTLAAQPEMAQHGDQIKALLGLKHWEVKPPMIWPLLTALPAERLLALAMETLLHDEADSAISNAAMNQIAHTPLMDWLISDQNVSTESQTVGTSPEPADEAGISLLFPCADCHTPDAGAFYVDANGYEVQKGGQFIGDWVCLGDMQKRQDAAHEDQIFCGRCEDPLTPGAFDNEATHNGRLVRMSSGELAVRGLVFCHQCGPLFDDAGKLISSEPEPWEYDRPDGLPSSSFAVDDAVEVRYEDKWLGGSVVGYDDINPSLVYVLVTGDSGPGLFGQEAIRRKEAIHA